MIQVKSSASVRTIVQTVIDELVECAPSCVSGIKHVHRTKFQRLRVHISTIYNRLSQPLLSPPTHTHQQVPSKREPLPVRDNVCIIVPASLLSKFSPIFPQASDTRNAESAVQATYQEYVLRIQQQGTRFHLYVPEIT